jgi:hypothetical protein
MITGMTSVRSGERFGLLVVIRELAPGLNKKSRLVAVRCDCGSETAVRRDKLCSGWTRSCGCLRKRHGHARGGIKSSTYRSWNGIMTRTTYVGASAHAIRYYRDHGVEVCARWRNSFANFIEDMGEKPDWADGGIDRIDPNEHYSCGHCVECETNGWPANCRWATRSQQVRNRRKKTDVEP